MASSRAATDSSVKRTRTDRSSAWRVDDGEGQGKEKGQAPEPRDEPSCGSPVDDSAPAAAIGRQGADGAPGCAFAARALLRAPHGGLRRARPRLQRGGNGAPSQGA